MKQTKRMVGWLVAGTAALSLGLVPLAAADPGTLSENESAELSFMREEERLARDLYQAFADKYDGARPFSMIVKAEQKHHDAVGTLMTRYDVADSSAGLPAGDYAFDALDELYQTWYAQGSASIESAIRCSWVAMASSKWACQSVPFNRSEKRKMFSLKYVPWRFITE